jgi:hypothetical protein
MLTSVSCLLVVLWGCPGEKEEELVVLLWLVRLSTIHLLNLYLFSVFYMTSLYSYVPTISTLFKCYYNYKDPHSYRDRIKNGTQISDFATSHLKKSFTILIR